MLRITDRLERGLILEVLDWDKTENKTNLLIREKQEHLDKLQATVRSIGIPLNVCKNTEKKLSGLLFLELRSVLYSRTSELLSL